jgi:hypothetical protein
MGTNVMQCISGKTDINNSYERAASFFRISKMMGQHFPYQFTWPDIPEENNLKKHVIPYLYNLPKILT